MNAAPVAILAAAYWWLWRSPRRNPDDTSNERATLEAELRAREAEMERSAAQLRMIDNLRRDERDKVLAKYTKLWGRVPVIPPETTPEWDRLNIAADRVKHRLRMMREQIVDVRVRLSSLNRNPRRAPTVHELTQRAAQLSLDAHGPSATPEARARYRAALDQSLHARAAAGDVATLPGFEDLAAAPAKGKSVQRGFFGLLD